MIADTDPTLLVALGTAVIVSILAPMVNGHMANKAKAVEFELRRAERLEDNRRQDEVAAQLVKTRESAEAYQAKVIERNASDAVAREKMAATMLATKATVASSAANQAVMKQDLGEVKRLGVVTHALVNSDKTSGMKREVTTLRATRAALMGQLAMAGEIAELKELAGRPVSQLAMQAVAGIREQIDNIDKEIDSVQTAVTERLNQQHFAEGGGKVPVTMPPGPLPPPLPPDPNVALPIHVEHAEITVADSAISPAVL